MQHVDSAMKCLFAAVIGILTGAASAAERDVRPVPAETMSIEKQLPILQGQLPVVPDAAISGVHTFAVHLNATTGQIGAVVGSTISNIGPVLAAPVTSSLPVGSIFGASRPR